MILHATDQFNGQSVVQSQHWQWCITLCLLLVHAW